jgi:hypothetical protein
MSNNKKKQDKKQPVTSKESNHEADIVNCNPDTKGINEAFAKAEKNRLNQIAENQRKKDQQKKSFPKPIVKPKPIEKEKNPLWPTKNGTDNDSGKGRGNNLTKEK